MGLDQVKNIILVLSGKGGVGKSSVTVQLALTLASKGHKVGILDADLTGPSIPRMLHVESETVQQASTGWVPVPACNGAISTMSIGFLLRSRNDSVVWRGPKKTAMVRQLCSDVDWGMLDYLLIDTPPGTSDEHIALAEVLRDHASRLRGAVVVTTPQAVSTADVRKELNFCVKVGFEVLGVVENMSGYVCPHCSECTNIFSSGGGKVMAEEFKVEFLGAIPIDPNLVLVFEEQDGEALLVKYKASGLFPLFGQLVDRVIEKCSAGTQAS